MGAVREYIPRNSGAHIALQIMKVLRRPVRPEEFAEISPKKLCSDHRKRYLKRLVELGYAAKVGSNPDMYQITPRGVQEIYAMTERPQR